MQGDTDQRVKEADMDIKSDERVSIKRNMLQKAFEKKMLIFYDNFIIL